MGKFLRRDAFLGGQPLGAAELGRQAAVVHRDARVTQHRFACALNERAADAIGVEVKDLMFGVRYEPLRGAYGDWITEMMTQLNVTENILRSTLFGKGPTQVNYLVGWAVLLEDPSAYPVPLTPGAELLGDLLPPASLVSSTPMSIRVPKRQAR